MTTPARSAVVLRAGMTHAAAKTAVAATWPDLVLHLYRPTTAYYKTGGPTDDSETDDADVLRPAADVLVAGGNRSETTRHAVYTAFGLEAVFAWRLPGLPVPDVPADTLDERQAFADRVRELFRAGHGRDPLPADDFGGLGLVVFGRPLPPPAEGCLPHLANDSPVADSPARRK